MSSAAAGLSGAVGAGTAGGVTAGVTTGAGMMAAAAPVATVGGGLGTLAKTALDVGVGSLVSAGVSEGAKALMPKPDAPDIPKIPDPKYAPPVEKIAAPSAPPTEGVATSNAFKAEERRRLLAGLPQQTQSVFTSAGGAPGKAKVNKPKLLGGGVGQMTAGV